MNRLTEKDDQGNWRLKGIRWEQLHEGQVITGELWEKLYGALWKLMEYEDTGMNPEEVERLNDFKKTQSYKLLKKLDDEEDKHRWIPVTERLPEDDAFVLVTVKGKYRGIIFEDAIEIANYYDGDGWELEAYPELDNPNVTAWQPLPAPYISEQEQDKPSGGWQEQMASTFLGDSRL